jgi:hypothetical protein
MLSLCRCNAKESVGPKIDPALDFFPRALESLPNTSIPLNISLFIDKPTHIQDGPTQEGS